MKRITLLMAALMVLSLMAVGCNAKKKEEAPKVVGSEAQVTATLKLIGTTRASNLPFLDTHAAMRDNINSLEGVANSLAQAPGNGQLQRMFGAALDQAIARADIIAKRASESADDKKRAAELRDKLTAIRKS